MSEALAQNDEQAAARRWPLRPSLSPEQLAAKGIAESDWADWGWQMRNRIRTAEALREWIDPTEEEEAATMVGSTIIVPVSAARDVIHLW